MHSKEANQIFDSAVTTMSRIVRDVSERGFDDEHVSVDDYSKLLPTFECRKAVIFQIYDNYFPARRHEFELQILTTITEAIAKNFQADPFGAAVASGIVGGVAYDLLKRLLGKASEILKPVKRTHIVLKEIEENADAVIRFFEKKSQGEIIDISNAVGTSPEKIEPVLKLLGFHCERKGKRRIWSPPPKNHKVKSLK